MFDYDGAKKLSDKIALLTDRKARYIHDDDQLINAENEWGAPHFYCSVLFKSTPQKHYYVTSEDLASFQDKFNSENGYSISYDDLIQEGWIRIVFGQVVIPKAIRSVLYHFDKIKGKENELDFFIKILSDPENKDTDQRQLNELAQIHETERQIKLDLESVKGILWFAKKEKVTVDKKYLKFLMDNFSRLSYINEIYYREKDRSLEIIKQDFEEIHVAHQRYFPATPPLSQLVATHGFPLSTDSRHYEVRLAHSETPFRGAIHDKSAALLWSQLVKADTFANDEERLFFWYMRVQYKFDYVQLANYLVEGEKQRFLDAALKIVLTDPDISEGPSEFRKLRLDHHHATLNEVITDIPDTSPEPGSSDLFELNQELKMLNSGHGDDLLFIQYCRSPINFFIAQIVRNDRGYKYQLIVKLLEQASNKPYIFWQTCFKLRYHHPEIIPFLLDHDSFSSLGFSLLFDIEINSGFSPDTSKYHQQVLTDSFAFIAKQVAHRTNVDPQINGRIIFQCLSKVIFRKFKIFIGADPEAHIRSKSDRLLLEESVKEAFELTDLPGTIYHSEIKYKASLSSELVESLYTQLQNFVAKDPYRNGTLAIPYVKLDLLDYLLYLTTAKHQRAGRDVVPDLVNNICRAFCETYLSAFNRKEIQARDFSDDGTLKPRVPIWHNNNENNGLIHWGRMCLYMEQHFHLDEFLAPANLKFSSTPDEYDEYNRFTAQKMRTHLFILITAYNQIYTQQRSEKLSVVPIDAVLSKIEAAVTGYIRRFCKVDAKNGRYDIFNDGLERGYGLGNRDEELLPIIGNVLNKFKREGRESVIEEMINTQQIIRSLKLLGFVISEYERARLLNVINGNQLIEYVKGLNTSDRQFVIQSLSKDESFIDHVEEALAFTEKAVSNRKSDFHHEEELLFIFRTKLLLAFHKGSEQDIDAVEDLVLKTGIAHKFSAQDEKDFYKALLYLKTNAAEKAYAIFNRQLSYSDDERPTLALNRFAAKLEWADNVSEIQEKRQLYQEALDEWERFEAGFSPRESLSYIAEKVLYNKLHAHESLGNDLDFDSLYRQLDKEIQLRSDFLGIRIRSYMRRNMQGQAEALLNKAKQLHQLSNGNYPEFIYELESITQTEETLKVLSDQYKRIFGCAPAQLVQIVPDYVNNGQSIDRFLLNEIVGSANDMLKHINSLSAVDHEDKYSDLILLALNGRLVNYQWLATTTRSGFADPEDQDRLDKANLGEVDFAIFAPNRERLATCEAMILAGKNTTETQKHNLKIFNYDHGRRLFFVITYYQGAPENFSKTWGKYISVVEDFIEFPSEYTIVGKKLTELNDVENESIKVALSEHATATKIYHVFINVNYQLKLKKKKVKSS